MRFHWSLAWEDDKGRTWVHEMLTAEEPSDARRRHASSCRGDWRTPDMRRPYVSPLFVEHEGRSTAIAEAAHLDTIGSAEQEAL